MVSSSKILTVSYGTFSCTAEGFDDPLAAVKEATQFYRSVVKEEPWFGAEPQQLDPDLVNDMMRAHVAQQAGEGRLSLGAPVAATSAAAVSAALAAGPATTELPDDEMIDAAAREAEEAEAEAAEADAQEEVAQDPVEAVDEPEHLEDTSVDAVEAVLGDEALEELADQADTSIDAADAPLDDLEADVADALSDEPDVFQDTIDVEADIVTAVAQPTVAPSSDVASRLDRIRNVVKNDGDDTNRPLEIEDILNADDLAEDTSVDEEIADALIESAEEDADAQSDETLSAIDALLADNADTLAQDDQGDVAGNSAEDALGSVEAELADTIASMMQEDVAPVEDAEAPAELGSTVAAEETGDLDALADDAAQSVQDALAEDLTVASDDAPLDLAAVAAAAAAEEPVVEVAPENTPAPKEIPAEPTEAAPARRATRVVKVKRAEFEKAVQSGDIEAVDALEAGEDTLSATLNADEEAELKRELDAVKAELAAEFGVEPTPAPDAKPAPLRLDNPVVAPSQPEAADLAALEAQAETVAAAPANGAADELEESLQNARKSVKLASPARALLTKQNVGEGDASRLLDQTNEELDEPEGNRRRSAIQHLRAAVAATRADSSMDRADPSEQEEPYREDLANVVRPRRPAAGAPRKERPAAAPAPQAVAPLQLVKEQRIDEAAPAHAPEPASTARPEPLRVVETGEGFVSYAESMGASDLPALLEAAAAYMSFVEGRDQFSRPQLMGVMRQAETEESTREDRLRSFGELLREGKIEKTGGGRFTASDRINFKPDVRAG